MRKTINRSTAITLALLGATAVGSLTVGSAWAADTAPLNETAAVESGFKPVGDFTNLVKRVTPAVVSITVHLKLDQTADDSDGNGDDNSDSGVLFKSFVTGTLFSGQRAQGYYDSQARACASRYSSYRASDNSYQPSQGPRRECR